MDKNLLEISKKVESNLDTIEKYFLDSEIIIKKITDTLKTRALYGVIYLDNSIDLNLLNRDVLRLIRNHVSKKTPRPVVISELEDSIGNIQAVNSLDEAMDYLMQGFVVFFAEGYEKAWVLELRGFPTREIQEPQAEIKARGPNVGFTEVLGHNTALLRRYLKTSELKFKTFVIGTKSKTLVELAYVESLIEKKLLEEIVNRLESINIDSIFGTGQLGELISDFPSSPFPQLLRTERPDKTATQLLEGRAVVMVDGQPDVLVVPIELIAFFQTLDEYNTPWIFGSLLRLLRWGSFLMAIFLPGLYISTVSLNHEFIPIEFLVIISESRSKVPYPPIIEAFLMELTIEILREAGIRMPGSLGQTIGIVGAIVIGQAAVDAGLASTIMVIVVAVTTIATFVLPAFEFGLTLRFLRFPLMLLASAFGFTGIMFGSAFIVAHLCILEVFGKPYLAPIAPFSTRGMQDAFITMPAFTITKRPAIAKDTTRQVTKRRKK